MGSRLRVAHGAQFLAVEQTRRARPALKCAATFCARRAARRPSCTSWHRPEPPPQPPARRAGRRASGDDDAAQGAGAGEEGADRRQHGREKRRTMNLQGHKSLHYLAAFLGGLW